MRHLIPRLVTRFSGCLALAALASIPVWSQDSAVTVPSQNPWTVTPGTINYVEGQAKIANQVLSSHSVGKMDLRAGDTLETENGRVEMLLTPGVFLRLGQGTAVTMVSPSLTNTKVAVNAGEATAEVDEYNSQNDLTVQVGSATAYLVHTGFYDFDPQQGFVRVIKGQAVVLRNDRHVRINAGQQVELFPEDAELKTTKFNANDYKKDDPLYNWSKLRSQYLAEANVHVAPYAYGWYSWGPGWWGPGWWGPGYGWYGPGWYWNPWFMSYTFIPGAGVLYSPFGWGFYSPWRVRSAPYRVVGPGQWRFDRSFDDWGRRGVEHTGRGARGAGDARPGLYGPGVAHSGHFGTLGGGLAGHR